MVIEAWCRHSNSMRPHGSLNSPAPPRIQADLSVNSQSGHLARMNGSKNPGRSDIFC